MDYLVYENIEHENPSTFSVEGKTNKIYGEHPNERTFTALLFAKQTF